MDCTRMNWQPLMAVRICFDLAVQVVDILLYIFYDIYFFCFCTI